MQGIIGVVFNALQREGVPSKMVLFPDEGRWVLQLQNGAFWYAQVLDWLGQFLAPDARSSQKSCR
jgi:dipeptidyl aminopeptidase/acylaminoacyl peptidase